MAADTAYRGRALFAGRTGAADVTLAWPRLPFAVGWTADFAWGQPGTWQVSNAIALGFLP